MSDFHKSLAILRTLFLQYSSRDIATSLFVSNLWLPNVSAVLKHPFLIGLFASLKPEEFQKENRIHTYDDFKHFIEQVYAALPSFQQFEDMIPEPDWGEVRYYLDGDTYRIFIGSEFSNVHDHLTQFELVHCLYDTEYRRDASRSPKEELKCCLKLQNHILSHVQPNFASDNLKIRPGHTEIPAESFWREAATFFETFDIQDFLSADQCKRYSMPLGSFDPSGLEPGALFDAFHEGTLLPAYAIQEGEQYFPILPRRYSGVLIEQWKDVFIEHGDRLLPKGKPLESDIGKALHNFIEQRLGGGQIYSQVSIPRADDSAHNLIFSTAFQAKNRLMLLYVLPPFAPDHVPIDELKALTAKLEEGMELLKKNPSRLILREQKQIVQFQRSDDGDEQLKPEIFVVIPQVSTGWYRVEIAPPGEFFGMDEFLMVVDELGSVSELAAYAEFLEQQTNAIFPVVNSKADIFSAYKATHGVLIGGASNPNFIMLDPNGGSYSRYESLACFWALYPSGDFGEPRHHTVSQVSGSAVRLSLRRNKLEFSLHCNIGSTSVMITAPFPELSLEEGKIANYITECIEHVLSRLADELKAHRFFQEKKELRIVVFPSTYVKRGEDMDDLQPLLPSPELWRMDIFHAEAGFPVARVVFDEEKMREGFQKAINASLEVDLAIDILKQLDALTPDPGMDAILSVLEQRKAEKPRFRMKAYRKPASFPNWVNPLSPTEHEYKFARKRVSEIADGLGIKEGHYEGEQAIMHLNAIRDVLVREIDAEVMKYDIETAIPFLIERADTLVNEREMKRLELDLSLEHEVDYDREKKYASQYDDFLRLHKHARYLIEKFVQLHPQGKKLLYADDFKKLSALTNWLHVLYDASDCLRYRAYANALIFDHERIVEVEYGKELDAKQEKYLQQLAKEELRPSGKDADKVASDVPVNDYLRKLDTAFRTDFGFGFRNLINVLDTLKQWTYWVDGEEEQTSYALPAEEIVKRCLQIYSDITEQNVRDILKFLTLQQEEITQVDGQNDPCKDLPVWEYRKRLMRYDIRPLILLDDIYHWGPYAMLLAERVWGNTPTRGTLPAAFPAPETEAVLNERNTEIQRKLETKALEISRRFTQYAESVDLHSRFPKSNYPQGLGDYDTLAYLPKTNVLLNMECKDLPSAYCLKDASRLRDRMFGRPGKKDEGHFAKIDRRAEFLSRNLPQIAADLGWPVDPSKPPTIVSVYITRHRNWWTRFPPNDIQGEFVRIDLLDDFLGGLQG